jgi:F420-dependent oxidoreductase-like protein
MRISLSVANFTSPGGPACLGQELSRVAVAADQLGFDSLSVMDHFFQIRLIGPPEREMLEGYTTLAFVAGQTSRLKLGTMVTGVHYRHPGILAKTVTTLDVLSGGRAWLGLGAGYHQGEAEMMGLFLPRTGERLDRMEEALRLALQMWAGDDTAFTGEHYRATRPLNSPPPLTRPRPPILVGGTGEKRTLHAVARYADACNVFDIPDGGTTIRHKLDVLAGHCAALGRTYETIEKTVSTRLGATESAASFVDRCGRFAELGIDHAIVLTSGFWTPDAVERLVEAVPAVGSS